MSRISPGSRVADRYAMLEELGGGGMGIVYRARDERDARDVAIKVLRHAPQGEAARRLRREARATSALDPNRVARVYDVGETPEGELYLVMEYVRGLTVRTFLNQGRLARPEALRILREVARTLGEAHRAGLVHRDVKPDNIIVCGDGRVVLLDFGIVKHMDDGDDAAKVSTQLTSEGTMLGTPAYLAPEQALGHDVGPAADQFALAVTAFEMLTGRLPWTATEVTRVLAQVLAETPPPASTIDKKLQPAFDAVLWRALSKTTTGRFATIESFARALDAADRGEYALSPASQTVGAPIAALTDAGRAGAIGAPIAALTDAGAAGPFAPSARRARWFVAGLAFLALGGAAVGLFARDHARTGLAAPSPPAPAAVLNDPGARLACPIFEVRGVPDVAGPLGAAGASLACMRAQWYLGGRHDRILPAASLLDLPTQPSEGFSDPYSAPGLRARTLELAHARASAYLDGIVTREGEGWRVALSIHAADAREIARAEGDDGTILAGAVKVATERL